MQIPASARVAAALGLPAGALVTARSRRGFANDLPISLGWSYHDVERFPDMAERRQAESSITEIYKTYGIADYRRQSTTIFTRLANEHETSLLMMRPGQSVLIVQKIDVDMEGRRSVFPKRPGPAIGCSSPSRMPRRATLPTKGPTMFNETMAAAGRIDPVMPKR